MGEIERCDCWMEVVVVLMRCVKSMDDELMREKSLLPKMLFRVCISSSL